MLAALDHLNVRIVTALTDVESSDDLAEATQVLTTAPARAEVIVTDAVHATTQAGVAAVAERNKAQSIWVAERDACLNCLAYSGHAAPFRWGLTFGEHPIKAWKTPLAPPLHGHCRCQLCAWNGYAPPGLGLPFPEALQREARRSVAIGLALPSESNPARARAAAVMLQRSNLGLPKTVVARARARLRSGKFTTRPAP